MGSVDVSKEYMKFVIWKHGIFEYGVPAGSRISKNKIVQLQGLTRRLLQPS